MRPRTEPPLIQGDYEYLPGSTRGFKDRVRRRGALVCTIYQPRWHGFARYEIEKCNEYGDSNMKMAVTVERGWIWRGWRAPYYEFGPTSTEIHSDIGDMLVDNVETAA